MTSNLEQDLMAAGFTPVPIPIEGVVAWTGWRAPDAADPPEDDEVCSDCGCFRWCCGGPGRYADPGAETTCACWDEEAREPNC